MSSQLKPLPTSVVPKTHDQIPGYWWGEVRPSYTYTKDFFHDVLGIGFGIGNVGMRKGETAKCRDKLNLQVSRKLKSVINLVIVTMAMTMTLNQINTSDLHILFGLKFQSEDDKGFKTAQVLACIL